MFAPGVHEAGEAVILSHTTYADCVSIPSGYEADGDL